MKSTKKLTLARESIRLLSTEALPGMPIAGGASVQVTCARGCDQSGTIACKPTQRLEECL